MPQFSTLNYWCNFHGDRYFISITRLNEISRADYAADLHTAQSVNTKYRNKFLNQNFLLWIISVIFRSN